MVPWSLPGARVHIGPHRSYVEFLVGPRRSRMRQVVFALTLFFSNNNLPNIRTNQKQTLKEKEGEWSFGVYAVLRSACIGAMRSSSSDVKEFAPRLGPNPNGDLGGAVGLGAGHWIGLGAGHWAGLGHNEAAPTRINHTEREEREESQEIQERQGRGTGRVHRC